MSKYIIAPTVKVGSVKPGTTIKPRFDFINCTVEGVKADCGCTTSTYSNNYVTLSYIVPSPSIQHIHQNASQDFSKGAVVTVKDSETNEISTVYITFIVTSIKK